MDGTFSNVPSGRDPQSVIVCLVLSTKRLTVRRSMYVLDVSLVCLNVIHRTVDAPGAEFDATMPMKQL